MDPETSTAESDERELLLPKKKLVQSKSDFFLIMMLLFLYLSSACVFILIGPIYTSEAIKKGTTTTVAGFVFSIYPFVGFLVSPFAGKFLPKIGPIRGLILGSFLEGFGEILFGFVTLFHEEWMFVLSSFLLRTVTAVGAAVSKTAILSIIWVLYPDNVSFLVGMMSFAAGFGLMAGPALGGLLYTIGGFKLPFIVMGVFVWLMLGGTVIILPRNRISAVSKKQSGVSVVRVLKIPGVFIVSMCLLTAGIATSFFESSLAIQLDHITNGKLSKAQIGAFFLFAPGFYMPCAPLCGLIVDKKIPGKYVMIFFFFLAAVTFILLGPVPFLQPVLSATLVSTAIALSLTGLSMGPYIVPVLGTMKTYATESGLENDLSLGSVISGLHGSFFSIGKGLGPIIGGLMLQYSTFAWGCFVVMVNILIDGTLLATFVLYNFYEERKKGHLQK